MQYATPEVADLVMTGRNSAIVSYQVQAAAAAPRPTKRATHADIPTPASARGASMFFGESRLTVPVCTVVAIAGSGFGQAQVDRWWVLRGSHLNCRRLPSAVHRRAEHQRAAAAAAQDERR